MKTMMILMTLIAASAMIPTAQADHACPDPGTDREYICENMHTPWRIVCDQIKKYVGPSLCWIFGDLEHEAQTALFSAAAGAEFIDFLGASDSDSFESQA
ncbi:MAG: hypothetical protein ACPGQL_03075 [Thermoplasmatota archaeon]